MQPSIKQLRYFCAVAEHRHFGRAAASCFITQSTLSAGIKELEVMLGVKVFERGKRQVLITEIGQELLTRAKHILEEMDELVESAVSSEAPLAGRLTLGVIPTIGPFLLPGLLAGLRHDYPQARVFLREDLTASLLADLSRGNLDAALLALPFPMGDFTTEPLFDDPFYLAGLPESPLMQIPDLMVTDLEECELLLLEEGHCLRQHALSACQLQSAKYGEPYQGTSLHTLVQMVANGLGVTLLPEMAVSSGLLKSTGVVARRFTEKSVKRSVGLVWRSTSSKLDDLKALATYIKNQHSG